MEEENLKTQFSPKRFREWGHELIDQLSEHLENCYLEKNTVTRYVHPDEELLYWQDYELSSFNQFIKDLLDRSIRVHHPKYIGHQVSVPLPGAALMGLVSDMANTGMGIYEMGQGPTAMEKYVTDEVCRRLGYSDKSGGFLTSGGTLANLSALLAARSNNINYKPETHYILVSDQAHYCIERAAITMGMPRDHVIKVATDHQYTIRLDALESAYAEVTNNGNHVMAVVGCACSTSTGSYDDIDALADFCEKYDLWLHVDGAHGGAVIFSSTYVHLVKGIHRADSVIIDAHKMMLIPALATFVLFKEDRLAYASFNQKASYLYEDQEPEWFQLTKRTYETTKYMMSAKLYWMFKSGGAGLLNDFITRQYDLARTFADIIRKTDDFEVGHRPMSNIVCFRYFPADSDPGTLHILNKRIRKAILLDGEFYIVQTELNAGTFLRITIMNPKTTIEDLELLLKVCRLKATTLPSIN